MHPDKRRGLYRVKNGRVEVLDKTYEYPETFNFVLDGSPAGGPYPGVRSPWYDGECRRRGSAYEIARDLDIDPTGSTHQYFSRVRIADLVEEFAIPPRWEGDLVYDADNGERPRLVKRHGGPLKLWVHPKDERMPPMKVSIGADPSQGTGATPSCVSALNVESGVKIAEYRNALIEPDDFAVFLCALGRICRDHDDRPALLIPECPGPGLTVIKTLKRIGYTRIWMSQDVLRRDKLRPRNPTLGFQAKPGSLGLLLSQYRSALYDKRFVNYSERALEETLEFRYTDRGEVKHSRLDSENDPSGARENHGDLVVADALAWLGATSLGIEKPKKAPVEEVKVNSLGFRRMLADRREREYAEF
jgi:hypothetical protein